MIVDDFENHYRKRRKELAKHKHQGLRAPNDKPYVAMGKLNNVLCVLDAVKKTIPHAQKLNTKTEKSIKILDSAFSNERINQPS